MHSDLPVPGNAADEAEAKQWQPLSSTQHRVVGVLIEKAKTTPDAYPMTLNSVTNACNQKSNRAPLTNLSTDDVEQALEELRELGAAGEVQSSGRVSKYRHYMYEWLGVGKVELAVMAELLLRGEQTVGELRGRASRMEPIADLQALRPVLDTLIEKQLVVELTPAGRGQVVAHNLYTPERLESLRQQYASGHSGDEVPAQPSRSSERSGGGAADRLAALEAEVALLREELQRLSDRIESIIGS